MAASYFGRTLCQCPTCRDGHRLRHLWPATPVLSSFSPHLLPRPLTAPAPHYVPRPLTQPATASSLCRWSSRSPRPHCHGCLCSYGHDDFRGLPDIPLTPLDTHDGFPTPYSLCQRLPLPELHPTKPLRTHSSTGYPTHSPENSELPRPCAIHPERYNILSAFPWPL